MTHRGHTKGTIHPSKTLFLRIEVGTAKNDESAFELAIDASNSAPIVQSKRTSKWFTLSWQDIIDLAIERGIEEV